MPQRSPKKRNVLQDVHFEQYDSRNSQAGDLRDHNGQGEQDCSQKRNRMVSGNKKKYHTFGKPLNPRSIISHGYSPEQLSQAEDEDDHLDSEMPESGRGRNIIRGEPFRRQTSHGQGAQQRSVEGQGHQEEDRRTTFYPNEASASSRYLQQSSQDYHQHQQHQHQQHEHQQHQELEHQHQQQQQQQQHQHQPDMSLRGRRMSEGSREQEFQDTLGSQNPNNTFGKPPVMCARRRRSATKTEKDSVFFRRKDTQQSLASLPKQPSTPKQTKKLPLQQIQVQQQPSGGHFGIEKQIVKPNSISFENRSPMRSAKKLGSTGDYHKGTTGDRKGWVSQKYVDSLVELHCTEMRNLKTKMALEQDNLKQEADLHNNQISEELRSVLESKDQVEGKASELQDQVSFPVYRILSLISQLCDYEKIVYNLQTQNELLKEENELLRQNCAAEKDKISMDRYEALKQRIFEENTLIKQQCQIELEEQAHDFNSQLQNKESSIHNKDQRIQVLEDEIDRIKTALHHAQYSNTQQ